MCIFRAGDQRGIGTQSAEPDEPNSSERRNATTRGNRRPTLRERTAECAAGRDNRVRSHCASVLTLTDATDRVRVNRNQCCVRKHTQILEKNSAI